MRFEWQQLTAPDQDKARAIRTFIANKLESRDAFKWALTAGSDSDIIKAAILDVLDHPAENVIGEPWASAWRVVEEAWSDEQFADHGDRWVYGVAGRVERGDRSGSVISHIAENVAPRLDVSVVDYLAGTTRLPKRPTSIQQLLNIRLTSCPLVEPENLALSRVGEAKFFDALARALQAHVERAIDISHRLYGDAAQFLHIGLLCRVYFVEESRIGEYEPDKFHQGIAPSVKLMYYAVSRLVQLQIDIALPHVQRWRNYRDPVHRRLWAAIAREPTCCSPDAVGEFLMSVSDQEFWNAYLFPEIAELRAMRFKDLSHRYQSDVIARLKKMQVAASDWRRISKARMNEFRHHSRNLEFKRIELGGGVLPSRESKIVSQDARVNSVTRIDHNFPGALTDSYDPPPPRVDFDGLAGPKRLEALEVALSARRELVEHSDASTAVTWIRTRDNAAKLIDDFETVKKVGADFPHVWNRFGQSHRPWSDRGSANFPESGLAERVLALILSLDDKCIEIAIDGLSEWMSSWRDLVIKSDKCEAVWSRLWQFATKVESNRGRDFQSSADDVSLGPTAPADRLGSWALNSPVGKLVGVFYATLAAHDDKHNPLMPGTMPYRMRRAFETADGRSLLIIQYRLIESLDGFLRLDRDWTTRFLVEALKRENPETIELWGALSSRTQFAETLKLVGTEMLNRVVDPDAGRDTRKSFVFSLVIECLHALLSEREPVVGFARVQQMLRRIGDDLRFEAAEAVQRFLNEIGRDNRPPVMSRSEVFDRAVAPFLARVWPQEVSLANPSVSEVFARLPLLSGDAFVRAVRSVERFLVPFRALSIRDYGFEGGAARQPLEAICTSDEASAALQLFDKTVGESEDAVVPYDLARALDRIERVAPNLVRDRRFRRLATAARR